MAVPAGPSMRRNPYLLPAREDTHHAGTLPWPTVELCHRRYRRARGAVHRLATDDRGVRPSRARTGRSAHRERCGEPGRTHRRPTHRGHRHRHGARQRLRTPRPGSATHAQLRRHPHPQRSLHHRRLPRTEGPARIRRHGGHPAPATGRHRPRAKRQPPRPGRARVAVHGDPGVEPGGGTRPRVERGRRRPTHPRLTAVRARRAQRELRAQRRPDVPLRRHIGLRSPLPDHHGDLRVLPIRHVGPGAGQLPARPRRRRREPARRVRLRGRGPAPDQARLSAGHRLPGQWGGRGEVRRRHHAVRAEHLSLLFNLCGFGVVRG